MPRDLHCWTIVRRLHDRGPLAVNRDRVVATAADGIVRDHVVRARVPEMDSVGIGGDQPGGSRPGHHLHMVHPA